MASHHSRKNPGMTVIGSKTNEPPTLGDKLKGKKMELEGRMNNDAKLMRMGQKYQTHHH